MIRHISDMSEICYEPSQIFQPSGARAAPSWLGPPIRLLRSCPVFDALGVGREALRLGVGWLWCGALLDRDWNAAVNILDAAGLAESLNARGGDVRRGLAQADRNADACETGTRRTVSLH